MTPRIVAATSRFPKTAELFHVSRQLFPQTELVAPFYHSEYNTAHWVIRVWRWHVCSSTEIFFKSFPQYVVNSKIFEHNWFFFPPSAPTPLILKWFFCLFNELSIYLPTHAYQQSTWEQQLSHLYAGVLCTDDHRSFTVSAHVFIYLFIDVHTVSVLECKP